MRMRSLLTLVGFAISFALPTYAQQKDLADPQTTQKILALMKAVNEAQNNNDPAARVALYTRDAVFVTPDGGPIIGRQAIQKWFTDLYQWWHPKNSIHKVDGDAPHLIGTAGNELWATGEWSETGQGKNGEPIPIKRYRWWHPKDYITKLDGNAVHLIGTAGNELWATAEWSETGQGKNGEPLSIKGHWTRIYVREGDDWKIRVSAMNTTPDSVRLINKSFAPQPAATPSPTASP